MARHTFLSDMGPRNATFADRSSLLSVDPTLIVPEEIRKLSDAELVTATKALRQGAVGYAWAVVLVLTALTAVWFGTVAAVVGCVIAIVGCRLALYLRDRSKGVERGQLAKREFCSRYHIGSLTVDEAAAEAQIARDPSIDSVLLYRAWVLPHGGHRFIRVELGERQSIAIYTTPFLGDVQRDPNALSRLTKLELALSTKHAERLTRMVSELSAEKFVSVEPRPVLLDAPLEATPCDIVVLRRGESSLRASMHFRGLASLDPLSAPEQLVSTLLEIEEEIADGEPLTGDAMLAQAAVQAAVPNTLG